MPKAAMTFMAWMSILACLFQAIWSILIYVQNKDVCPGGGLQWNSSAGNNTGAFEACCNQSLLSTWFVVFGAGMIVPQFYNLYTQFVLCCKNAKDIVHDGYSVVGEPVGCCQSCMRFAYYMFKFSTLIWYLLGNLYIWGSNDDDCGALASDGKMLLFISYPTWL